MSPRYSVLLIGEVDARAGLRTMLPEGAIVAESDAAQASARLETVTFDLVLADSSNVELLVAIEQQLAWNREYRPVPRFYFVERGAVAPMLSRHVYVLEKPINGALLAACLNRLLSGADAEPLHSPERAAS